MNNARQRRTNLNEDDRQAATIFRAEQQAEQDRRAHKKLRKYVLRWLEDPRNSAPWTCFPHRKWEAPANCRDG